MTLLGTVIGRGTLAARPAAASAGRLYYATDSPGTMYRDNGSSWDSVETTGTGLADQGTATFLDFTTAAAPASPAAGKIRVYSKTGDTFAQKTSGGTETVFGAGGGAAGALVFLAAQTASASAQLDFTSFITSTYEAYEFHFINVIPATNTADFQMRMGTGAGPTYDTGANYGSASWEFRAGGGAAGGAEGAATSIGLTRNGLSTTASWSLNGRLTLYNPGGSIFKWVNGMISELGTSGGTFRITGLVGGSYESTTAVTAIRFLMSSGNITSGVIRVYGIAKT